METVKFSRKKDLELTVEDVFNFSKEPVVDGRFMVFGIIAYVTVQQSNMYEDCYIVQLNYLRKHIQNVARGKTPFNVVFKSIIDEFYRNERGKISIIFKSEEEKNHEI